MKMKVLSKIETNQVSGGDDWAHTPDGQAPADGGYTYCVLENMFQNGPSFSAFWDCLF
jgi:hypothetical protein